jgi:hypothetical protein
MPTWDEFAAYCQQTLRREVRQGRASLRPSRIALTELIQSAVLASLSPQDQAKLFPLGFDPEASDLKIAAGVGLERGLITENDYHLALLDDLRRSPLAFLQTVSGKAFGETVAPKITSFWIMQPGDGLAKQPGSTYFDLLWRPSEKRAGLLIELKASSEAPGFRFQQIRDPWMGKAATMDYDVLLCLGATNSGLEWWVIPATQIMPLYQERILTNQHGGQKSEGNTLWMSMDTRTRNRLQEFFVQSENLRTRLLELTSE